MVLPIYQFNCIIKYPHYTYTLYTHPLVQHIHTIDSLRFYTKYNIPFAQKYKKKTHTSLFLNINLFIIFCSLVN